MLTQTSKIIISIIMSAYSIVLFAALRGRNRKICMIAMFLSTLGDLFMIDDLVPMDSDLAIIIGAVFFMLSHLVYSYCFISASKRKGYKFFNGGFIAGVCTIVAATGALTAAMFIKTGQMQKMYLPLLIYLAIIGLNIACQFSYAVSEKGNRLFLILGMLLFLVSDCTIFLWMLNIMPAHNDLVWFTYIPAQLLILTFNSPLKRVNAVEGE